MSEFRLSGGTAMSLDRFRRETTGQGAFHLRDPEYAVVSGAGHGNTDTPSSVSATSTPTRA